jgi:hypothetical protein
MAVKHELPDDDGIGEGDQDFHRTADGEIHDVLMADERYRLAVNLRHLEIELVNVKDVLLVGDVLDRPLLYRAECGLDIDPVGIEL